MGLDQMIDRKYWKTQWVLKRKWLLNRFFGNKHSDFSKFVILCDPRTGSTWLHTLLNSNPGIISYGEYLTEHEIPPNFSSTIWKPHHKSIKAIGVKIFYEQLHEERYEHLRSALIADEHIKIIDLNREDQLKMYVSLKRAESTDDWSTTRNDLGSNLRIRIDKEDFNDYRDRIKHQRKQMLGDLLHHPVYSISYEQLLSHTVETLQDIQNFIKVKPSDLFSILKKQNDRPMDQLVENHHDFE